MACEDCARLAREVGRIEDIAALQYGALEEIGKLISLMPGGLVAKLCIILERHGVKVRRPQQPLP